MSVKTTNEMVVEEIMAQIALHIRQMPTHPSNPKRNTIIQEVAAVIECMSPGALRYQLLSVPLSKIPK